MALGVTISEDDGRARWRYELRFTQDSGKRPVITREVVEDLEAGKVLLDRPDEDDRRDHLRKT